MLVNFDSIFKNKMYQTNFMFLIYVPQTIVMKSFSDFTMTSVATDFKSMEGLNGAADELAIWGTMATNTGILLSNMGGVVADVGKGVAANSAIILENTMKLLGLNSTELAILGTSTELPKIKNEITILKTYNGRQILRNRIDSDNIWSAKFYCTQDMSLYDYFILWYMANNRTGADLAKWEEVQIMLLDMSGLPTKIITLKGVMPIKIPDLGELSHANKDTLITLDCEFSFDDINYNSSLLDGNNAFAFGCNTASQNIRKIGSMIGMSTTAINNALSGLKTVFGG